ncbi:MAG: AAA family ATPase [Thermoguttaceae bacterium]|jgi:cellulose biosynthesis protein BcsQ
MSVKVIAFFNNKGGVGKTTLVYHLAWMFAERGKRVLAVDLDPQANLSAFFLDEECLEELWSDERVHKTIYGAVQPLQKVGDITQPYLELIRERLALIPGDMALSGFEDDLSEAWPNCLAKKERAFLIISAFWRVIQQGASIHNADMILIDLGPNLGATNRAAMIASDFIVIPLAPDLFSLQGLRNLGPRVSKWREDWRERLKINPDKNLMLPPGRIQPIGYIVLQHATREDRPVKSYEKWIARIPQAYSSYVLGKSEKDVYTVMTDPNCLALLRHYRSLMPMAQEARKPIFFLKPADGALGAHTSAVKNVYKDFENLALKIAERTGVPWPHRPVQKVFSDLEEK